MTLRPALSAAALGVLLAIAHASPAQAHHVPTPREVPTVASGEITEPETVVSDELTESPTLPNDDELAEPTAPSDSVDLPAPVETKDPVEPSQSPVPKKLPGLAHPEDPAESSHPAEPIELPQPIDFSDSATPEVPVHLWAETYSADPTPAPVEGLADPRDSTRSTAPPGDEKLADPPTSGEAELSEAPTVPSETATHPYQQPVALDARLEGFQEDPIPQLREELLTKSVPWKQPEGVAAVASPAEMTEDSLAQAGAISRTLLIGAAILITAGAVLLFWNRRPSEQSKASKDVAS